MATRDDLNTPAIAVVGFVGAIIVFAVIVLLMVVFHHVQSRQRYAKDISQPYLQVSRLVADQQGRLASYGWLDQKQGIAHVPITRAMELVVAELSRDPRAPVTGTASRSPAPGVAQKVHQQPQGKKEDKHGQ